MAEAMKGVEKIEKQLGGQFYDEHWAFRGSEFCHTACGGVDGYKACLHFICGFMWVKVRIFTEQEYGIPNSVRMFTGENAAEECIRWTAKKLFEVYETVSVRTAPYESGYRKYQKALKGGK